MATQAVKVTYGYRNPSFTERLAARLQGPVSVKVYAEKDATIAQRIVFRYANKDTVPTPGELRLLAKSLRTSKVSVVPGAITVLAARLPPDFASNRTPPVVRFVYFAPIGTTPFVGLGGEIARVVKAAAPFETVHFYHHLDVSTVVDTVVFLPPPGGIEWPRDLSVLHEVFQKIDPDWTPGTRSEKLFVDSRGRLCVSDFRFPTC
jgi:hypothetical protein